MEDSIFDPKNKVVTQHNGQIYKFESYTPGVKFTGTYLGSHVWTDPKSQKEVTAYDFANCSFWGADGVAHPKPSENQVYTINEVVVLANLMEQVQPGMIIGVKYLGRGQAKGLKQGAHLFEPYINPSMVDPNYRRFQEVTAEQVTTPTGGASPTSAFFPQTGTPAPVADEPFASDVREVSLAIMKIAKEKLGAVEENSAKVKVMEKTGLA